MEHSYIFLDVVDCQLFAISELLISFLAPNEIACREISVLGTSDCTAQAHKRHIIRGQSKQAAATLVTFT